MVCRIAAWLASRGVIDLVLNLHHLPATLTTVVGDGSDLGARVRYSWEQPRLLGTAGGPRQALSILEADTFFLVNGDTLTDVSLDALASAHAASGALVTLALVPNREFERYGGVEVDERGHVIGFAKPGPASKDSWHFVGVQVVHASVFASLPEGQPANTVGGIYDDLIGRRPGAVQAFCSDAAYWDIGTPGDYLRTSRAFSTEASSWVDVGRRARIDPSAHVSASILWDDVEVGPGASLEACIVTDNVRVPAGAAYTGSILMETDDGLAVVPIDA